MAKEEAITTDVESGDVTTDPALKERFRKAATSIGGRKLYELFVEFYSDEEAGHESDRPAPHKSSS